MKFLVPLILLLAPALASAQDSLYTSVAAQDCLEVISSEVVEDAPIDFYDGLCPGLGGYEVIVGGGDLRYDLALRYRGQDLPALTPLQGFRDMGSTKIEWRYARHPQSRKAELKALIFRINQSTEAEGQFEVTSYLHVVRLAGKDTCTVAIVSEGNALNEQARMIADQVDQYACIDTELF